MMATYIPPYTVTVSSTANGFAACAYTDGNGVAVPEDTVLTTTTAAGKAGNLEFRFTEVPVSGVALRLVGATVKTLGHDPALAPYNNLYAKREETADGYVDTLSVSWAPDAYTTRGVVLLFAQVDAKGGMLNLVPSTDPEVQNGPDS
ncbi:MAG: hypothetical protein GXC94_01825 [Comamonadaceae bacterium]|jgi:hypothetical protein|nr:hypothetical protein [Comamonadaceae bacterium]